MHRSPQPNLLNKWKAPQVSKNHPVGVKDIPSFKKEARMYETDNPNDGFKALKMYTVNIINLDNVNEIDCVSKVNHDCTSFFKYPRRNWSENDEVCFEARPVGQNKLGNMMKDISKASRPIKYLHQPLCKSHGNNIMVKRWSD
ncbi:hypothetical protein QZH41_020441 [Actinostola sp. cb2023]|nr:hypothetical protein QZH41_020441 [Actinostola sp. cb2023]